MNPEKLKEMHQRENNQEAVARYEMINNLKKEKKKHKMKQRFAVPCKNKKIKNQNNKKILDNFDNECNTDNESQNESSIQTEIKLPSDI